MPMMTITAGVYALTIRCGVITTDVVGGVSDSSFAGPSSRGES